MANKNPNKATQFSKKNQPPASKKRGPKKKTIVNALIKEAFGTDQLTIEAIRAGKININHAADILTKNWLEFVTDKSKAFRFQATDKLTKYVFPSKKEVQLEGNNSVVKINYVDKSKPKPADPAQEDLFAGDKK